MASAADTIAAVATPPGRGAIAIVRISGGDACSIARAVTGRQPIPRRATFCEFRAADGHPVDQGLVLYFPGPRSFTGEDIVELHGHGGAIVSDSVLAAVLGQGARLAEPGEFTLRAFLHDKLDLTQAEAIADLIDSGSQAAARAALRSLVGQFSKQVQAVQAGVTELRAQVEAWLDFPDEDLERDDTERLAEKFDAVLARLAALMAQARQGAVLGSGLSVVIAGPPNAGKSSLLNRLAGYDAAIVTQYPGTTRDPLKEFISLDGLPINLVDTAGLRESEDPVELEGMRRSHAAVRLADRLLWVIDVHTDLESTRAAIEQTLGGQSGLTIIQNKVDLIAAEAAAFQVDGIPVVRMSALNGDGLGLLIEHLKSVAGYTGEGGGTISARTRHIDALGRAQLRIAAARKQLMDQRSLELAAEELRAAQSALGEVTGEVTSDDLLGEIFSSFCIGK